MKQRSMEKKQALQAMRLQQASQPLPVGVVITV